MAKKTKSSTTQGNERQSRTGGKVAPLGSANTRKSRQTKSGTKAKSAKPAATLTYEQIAQRAESIWRDRGCPAGQDQQNWREAEAQLKDELGIT